MTFNSVIIVGSGAAGIGIASLLNQTDIDYIILEKKVTGASFLEWPQAMEMITPSFPSNSFKQVDLNSICEATSPAFSFNKEHLTGKEYAQYLSSVVDSFEINTKTNTEVKKVAKKHDGWQLETTQGLFSCKYLIWATGEFQNPKIENIIGAEHCIHSSLIKDVNLLKGKDFVVVGGYESGVQMAHDLIQNDKKVTIINPDRIDNIYTSDPSKVLSPYTYEKYREIRNSTNYTEILGEVTSVTKRDSAYQIQLKDNVVIRNENKPICATGFSLVKNVVEEFITYREDGNPKLNENSDEFYGCQNIYLSGPSVRHDNHIFCFIYKFRQRFGIIVEDILRKEKYKIKDIEALVDRWKYNGMYLSDLSYCDNECVC